MSLLGPVGAPAAARVGIAQGTGVDWDALMRLGLGRLRLTPETFWAMTPVELERAAEGAGLALPAGAAPDRQTLATLMARYPDGERDDGKTG